MSDDILSENKSCQSYSFSSFTDISEEPCHPAFNDLQRPLANPFGPLQVDGTTDLVSPSCYNPLSHGCPFCTLTFTSEEHLNGHLMNYHSCFPTAFKCHVCEIVYRAKSDFLDHIQTLHISSNNLQLIIMYKCLNCYYETRSESDLQRHIETSHLSPVVTCEVCNLSFNDSRNLNNHISLFHSNPSTLLTPSCHPDLPMHVDGELLLQNIPQIDGPNQELYEFADLPAVSSSRTASYSLNQGKQTRKIIEDASLNDYEVTVNNADQNATVKCSSGFYIQVAKASFTLEKPTVLSAANVTVTVDEVIITKDKNGLEATKLIHFSFMNEQEALGGVAVHLHHSNRTIQIQGSHIMPDSTRAALWFLNNVTLIRFRNIAKTKKFEIKNFNDAAVKIPKKRVPNHPNLNSCQSCHSIFNTQSKPSQCICCSKFFHKRCIKEHLKECRRQSPPTPLPSAPVSPLSISQSKRSRLASTDIASAIPAQDRPHPTEIPGIKSSLYFVPSASSFQRPSTTTSMSLSSSTSLPSRVSTATTFSSRILSHQSSSTPQPVSVPDVLSPPTTTSATGTLSSSSTSSSRTLPGLPGAPPLSVGPHVSIRPANKKQKSVPTTSADHSREILEKELNAAQTKIVMLDSQLKDKDEERAVLYARIKILEEKQNTEILNKYFPHPEAQFKSSSSSSKTPTIPSPQKQSCQACQTCPSPAPSCTHTRCSAAPTPTCATVTCACSTPMYLLPARCPGHVQPHAPLNCQHSGEEYLAVVKSVESSKKEIENLRNEIVKLETFLVEINQKSTVLPDVSAPRDDQPIEETETATDDPVPPSNDGNASIASVEEFIDEIYIDPKPSSSAQLNCKDLTIQLT